MHLVYIVSSKDKRIIPVEGDDDLNRVGSSIPLKDEDELVAISRD